MNKSRIVPMANQIATFFRSYPHDEAVQGVADHITSFWDPRMREELWAHLHAGGDGLVPLAQEAAEKLEAARKEPGNAEHAPVNRKPGGGVHKVAGMPPPGAEGDAEDGTKRPSPTPYS